MQVDFSLVELSTLAELSQALADRMQSDFTLSTGYLESC